MSLSTNAEGREVHYPAKADRFEFDKDVSKIFPSMAVRSIPNYTAAHQLHASIAAEHFLMDGAAVLDVGASRGAFFDALYDVYQKRGESVPDMRMVAVDNSPTMCALLQKDFLNVEVRCQDLARDQFLTSKETFDVINCTYVIQFLPVAMQVTLLKKLHGMLNPGGVLFLGQKNATSTFLGRIMHDEYINFRIDNGYTRAEVEAKTKALANSMWPMHRDTLLFHLHALKFREIIETTRYTVFSTLMAFK